MRALCDALLPGDGTAEATIATRQAEAGQVVAAGQTVFTLAADQGREVSFSLPENRIRQFEDFFNVSGMGTADDLEEFRACQAGYAGSAVRWNDMSRGAPLWIEGPDENAKKMGMSPLLSGERSEDEGLFVCQHDYWAKTMRQALQQERAGAQP